MASEIAQLFVSFLKLGVVGYGGGPSMIPLVQAEVVDGRGWMTNEQFADALAAGNALPGPIATKMAVFIGYQTAGAAGALAGLLGLLLPSSVLMVALYALLARHADHPRVAGALGGVRPVVVAMLVWVAIELAPASVTDWRTGALGVLALVALALKVHPAWLIAGAAALGATALAR